VAGPRALEGHGRREHVVEREEDGLLRSSAVEMPPGGAKVRWRARSLRQSTVIEAAWRSAAMVSRRPVVALR
jgi:hypothetical protein